MITLRRRGEPVGIENVLVGLVHRPAGDDGVAELYSEVASKGKPTGIRAVLASDTTVPQRLASIPRVVSVPDLATLRDGDIVSVEPRGVITTLFRVGSGNNSLFVTEQCNSWCLMCSQPPRRVDDIDRLLAVNARAVRLMPKSLPTLGITGGEPTLLGSRLVELLRLIRMELPNTQIEILSNGRRFANDEFTANIASVANDSVLFSIPLYSDHAARHDFVVQSAGAFEETVLGLYSLALHGVRRELRVVLHKETYPRLLQLARFIQRNLPFVEHVAFMGLEVTGFARANQTSLWVEPQAYAMQLSDALDHLGAFGIPASIYNVPLCLLPERLRPSARISISDWKREYLPACAQCRLREKCGGVFGTSIRQSEFIRPVA